MAHKATMRRIATALGIGSCLFTGTASADDLTLQGAIQRALVNQAVVQQAQHMIAESEDQGRAAHADLLPALSLSTGGIWTQTQNGQPRFVSANGARELVGQVRLQIPLYAPQAYALSALARDRSAIARYRLQQARLEVAAQVTMAYYQLALDDNELAVWRRALTAARQMFVATQEGYRAGTRSRLDLSQSKLTLVRIRMGLDQARPRARAARQVLALQTGYGVAALPALAPVATPLTALPGPKILRQQANQSQPLLRVADGEIQSARSLLHYRRAARLPVIAATGAYGVDTSTLPQSQQLGWQAILSLQMPIFRFGRNRDLVAAAQEQVAAMQSAKAALQLQIRGRLAADYGAAQAAANALQDAQTLAQTARTVYTMTRKGYLAGAESALALQQAENGWVQAQLQTAGAAIRTRLTRAQLALDSGLLPDQRKPS
ncbi:TolC family protein [Acidithiobacillus ferrooxidans F221]|nr:TolC family protein [Acidithiobacillus ferrooxidans F221]